MLLLTPMTFLSNVGSPTATVDGVAFLSSWLGLPAASSTLYVELLVVVRYGMLMTSVTGFAFLSILVTLAYYGKLRVRPLKLARAIALPMLAIAGLALGTRAVQEHFVGDARRPYLNFTLSYATTEGIQHEILTDTARARTTPADTQGDDRVLATIQETGEIWVGYNAGIIPYCYHNAQGELVGYDVEAAYSLAQSLNAKLVLVPFEWESLVDDLNARRFDIAMSGIYVTNERMREVTVSSPYYDSPVALFAPRESIEQFESRASIQRKDGLRIGVFDDPVLIPRLKRLLPNAEVVVVDSYAQLPDFNKIDAAIWSLEQSRALAAANPHVQAIAPKDMGSNFLFAYLMPRDEVQWRNYVDYWLEVRSREGELDASKAYWIDGHPRDDDRPRWSILHDVLHWDG